MWLYFIVTIASIGYNSPTLPAITVILIAILLPLTLLVVLLSIILVVCCVVKMKCTPSKPAAVKGESYYDVIAETGTVMERERSGQATVVGVDMVRNEAYETTASRQDQGEYETV